MREALKVIAEDRDSTRLIQFLETGRDRESVSEYLLSYCSDQRATSGRRGCFADSSRYAAGS